MENVLVCALAFERDKNLSGRIYYYLVDFPAELDDEIVVPLNVHGRLQVGKVVKKYVLSPDGKLLPEKKGLLHFLTSRLFCEKLPFRPERLKSALCPFGYRRVSLPSACNTRDLGGLFYDEKHVTAYGNFLRGDEPEGDISACGVDSLVCFGGDIPADCAVPVRVFPSLFSAEKMGAVDALYAFDVYGEEEKEGEFFPSEEEFERAFSQGGALREVFSFLASLSGTVLLCDTFGSRSVELVCMILYLLAGVSLGDIAREREITRKALSRKSKQNVKFSNFATSIPSQGETLSFLKNFLEKYGGAEKFLLSVGLTQGEIDRLRYRMTSVNGN